MDDQLDQIYAAALDAMRSAGPRALGKRVEFEAAELDADELAQPQVLAARLEKGRNDDSVVLRFRRQLALWDADTVSSWVGDTPPRTDERRSHIYTLLQADDVLQEVLDRHMPVAKDEAVLISREFEPWFGEVMQDRGFFYWDHYSSYLAGVGWHENSIAAIDLNTTRIVERLADPQRIEAYQAKGLVVGYVQSGKTANFTGVIAKAIDAGYRLIVVLTGTTDLLRGQTQRRLDKELVGRENLLRGIDADDADALHSVDYVGDPDWTSFVQHGTLPSEQARPDVLRLTTAAGDYKSLQQGIASLDFERLDPSLALNHPTNLQRVPARLAIVKKNKTVLTKLVKDLKKITARLADIPVLIIDDESDQASINTTNPKKWEEGRPDRTAINSLVSQLLSLLPRGQYVGYTATPFANVFVDPGDAVDVFPRDFILSLDRPPGYMGATDFHDLTDPSDDEPEQTVATSNELAFVRPVSDNQDHAVLLEAIHMFVLSGALKLYRDANGSESGPFRHHTMLVHESVRKAEHQQLADDIRALWATAGFYGPRGIGSLRELYHADVLPVMEVRADGEAFPVSFDELKPYISKTVSSIEGSSGDPVIVVNSDQEMASEDIDFGRRQVWRILVGGTKLSRGFTVEGLTVSYYRRVTRQSDTLMQMGRWFGFRRGYRDLVRLYIERGDPNGSSYDLYMGFEAACLSEEMFRTELEKYAVVVDGKPQITPAQVPPLVAQHIGWLKPSAANKMYNARLVERRSPGERLEPAGYPKSPHELERNASALSPLLAACHEPAVELGYRTPNGGLRGYSAYAGVVPHPTVLGALGDLTWLPEDHFAADLTWLAGLDESQLEDWAVILPQHVSKGARATVFDRVFSIYTRIRRRDPLFGAISDPKHRVAAAHIAGIEPLVGVPDADRLRGERRGSILIYPVFELGDAETVPSVLEPEELVLALVFFAPLSTGSADGTRVRFVVRDSSKPDDAIVEQANA